MSDNKLPVKTYRPVKSYCGTFTGMWMEAAPDSDFTLASDYRALLERNERLSGAMEYAIGQIRGLCCQTCKHWPKGRHAPNCIFDVAEELESALKEAGESTPPAAAEVSPEPS